MSLKQVIDYLDELGPILRAGIEALDKSDREVERLRKREKIGSQMANLCFNLKQRSDHVLSGREVAILKGLQESWDALAAPPEGGE